MDVIEYAENLENTLQIIISSKTRAFVNCCLARIKRISQENNTSGGSRNLTKLRITEKNGNVKFLFIFLII